MFAGHNFLRAKLMKDLKLEEFSFSGNYLMFYDKLEKANWFLENVLEHLDDPIDSRMMHYLLDVVTICSSIW